MIKCGKVKRKFHDMNSVGKYISQPEGYKAFIPDPFPPKDKFVFSGQLIKKHSEAMRVLGKLDGITELLPDKDWFILMFLRKDASSSSQIEGTNATMMDSIERENIDPSVNLPQDVDDILHYIKALNYGLKRIEEFPFSLRFIKELHEKLMQGARSTQFSYPGEFRKKQNWISGTRPDNAKYVPPTVVEMKRSLGDLELFINSDKDDYLPLIKTALIHSQFETIHPFNDGNGRTGRMLVAMYLWQQKLLESPVLYLSSYFKKYQEVYYSRLNGYHNGEVEEWVDFFLDGVIEIANSAIVTCAKITKLRERDMMKVQKLNRVASEATLKILTGLYKMPIVGVSDIQKWTKYQQSGVYKAIDRMKDMGILEPIKTGDKPYAQKWVYREYLNLFSEEAEAKNE